MVEVEYWGLVAVEVRYLVIVVELETGYPVGPVGTPGTLVEGSSVPVLDEGTAVLGVDTGYPGALVLGFCSLVLEITTLELEAGYPGTVAGVVSVSVTGQTVVVRGIVSVVT